MKFLQKLLEAITRLLAKNSSMIETPYLQGGSIKVIGEFPTYFWVTLPLIAKDCYFFTIPWLHLKKYEFVISYTVAQILRKKINATSITNAMFIWACSKFDYDKTGLIVRATEDTIINKGQVAQTIGSTVMFQLLLGNSNIPIKFKAWWKKFIVIRHPIKQFTIGEVPMEGSEKTQLIIPIEKKLFLFTAIVIFKFLRTMRHTYLQMYGMHF